jgi:hypothetical protein
MKIRLHVDFALDNQTIGLVHEGFYLDIHSCADRKMKVDYHSVVVVVPLHKVLRHQG